jgi:capsular polysaccharide export protein
VVLANSTVGLHAARAGVPTIALGEAVYDIPGITHQGGIDSFWTTPEPVDARLERLMVRAMAAEIQVRGSFYDKAGQKAAIAEIVDRLTRRPYPAWAQD